MEQLEVFNTWCSSIESHNLDDRAKKFLNKDEIIVDAFQYLYAKYKDKFKETNFKNIIDSLRFISAYNFATNEINIKLKKCRLYTEHFSSFDEQYFDLFLIKRDYESNNPFIKTKKILISGYKPYTINIYTKYNKLWEQIEPKFLNLFYDKFNSLKKI